MPHTTTDIDRLLQRGQVNESQLVEILVDQYYAQIQHLALNILRNPDDAEDATQETFITAITKIDQYRPDSNFKAWLYTIAVNTSRGLLRKYKTRLNLQGMLQSLVSLGQKPPTPEEAVLRSEADARLWDAVNTLGEKHRLPVLLRYIHNLPIRDIAQILEVNEGTIRSRLHYATRKLNGILQRASTPQTAIPH